MRLAHVLAALGLAAVTSAGACRMREEEPRPTKLKTEPAEPAPSRARPLFVHARPGDAAAAVRAEVDGVRGAREVLVYVGATWCEPCQRFHAAVERGELDQALPRLTLVEFDLDQDRERLAEAGYVSQYIPLFAAPKPDGRSSDRRIEGSVKGPGAPSDLTARLRTLLAP